MLIVNRFNKLLGITHNFLLSFKFSAVVYGIILLQAKRGNSPSNNFTIINNH